MITFFAGCAKEKQFAQQIESSNIVFFKSIGFEVLPGNVRLINSNIFSKVVTLWSAVLLGHEGEVAAGF